MFHKKAKPELKSWHLFLLVGIIATALILRVLQMQQREEEPSSITPVVILNQTTCADAGGTWNDCGSACRGSDTEACIQLCVAMCECTTDDQCPYSHTCGQKIDGVGICTKTTL